MAVIGLTTRDVNGVITDTVVTASASDTFTYTQGTGMYAVLDNTTGGLLTAVIKGSAPSATYPIGGTPDVKDLTAGYSVAIPASTKKSINLDKIAPYLAGNGTVTISGAATLKITIYA